MVLCGCPYNPDKEIFVDLLTGNFGVDGRTAGGATTATTGTTADCCSPPLPWSTEDDDDVTNDDGVIHFVNFNDGFTLAP